ncbi:hypothetical protein FBUS_02082 [Fasciolopsis buskii]|uniref:Uncharacterized protein n=1 Tax=Fasciolopsis buskii TaxID=27845 RepID=A0A8E0RVR7_9TREM|nr:hypothetical protein FBUS_02082 [Fasciolopsis buski]
MTDAARLTWLASLSTGAMFMNFCLITGIFQISLLRLWRTVNNVVGHARRPCAHLIRCIHSSDAGCTGPAEPKTEASSPHTKSSRLNVGRDARFTEPNICLDSVLQVVSAFHFQIPSVIQNASVDLLLVGTLLDPVLFFYGLRSIRFSFARCWCRHALENVIFPHKRQDQAQTETNQLHISVVRVDVDFRSV